MSKQTADHILNTSTLLTKDNCKIIDDVVFERLSDKHLDEFFNGNCDVFRFFFTPNDYDYVEPDSKLHETLTRLFK